MIYTREYIRAFSTLSPVATNVPLPDGRYKGFRYAWVIEIDGITYTTLTGVRCTKGYSGGEKDIYIKDNKAYMF